MKAAAAVCATAFLCLSLEGSARPADSARSYLSASFGLTAAEIAQVDAGQVVSRTLDARDAREVATMGVMRARISPAFYAERLADITSFKKDDDILQIGLFGAQPTVHDVANLTLDDSDLRSLEKCRVGHCGVQLPAAAIERFRAGVDWRQPDAHEKANTVMRRILVDYVAAYLASGASAAMEYADQRQTTNLAREFAALAESGDRGVRQFPGLHRYLLGFPSDKTPDTLDAIYWSKERIGRRPVVSVTHLSVRRTLDESPADYAIASKHIYGTHYFDASLGLTVLVRDPRVTTPATYVVYVNHSRLDAFDGLFGRLARRVVVSRARSLVSNQLAGIQQRLERQFTAAQTP